MTRCCGRISPASRIALFASSIRAGFAMNWPLEAIAVKLTAARTGRVGRMIINLPPRHLESHLASVAFPAWCLEHLYKQQYEAQQAAASQTTRPEPLSVMARRLGILRWL
jgi:hypothetical protein